MFGHYFRMLDDKNRVVVPPKFKKGLGSLFYVTLGPDRILEIRDQKSFNLLREKLSGTNMLNSNARKFSRILLGNTIETSLDKVGRIAIPDSFLKNSGITSKEIAFVGVGNKIEIWPKDRFEKLQKEFNSTSSLDELAKKLMKDGVEL